jgi:hypothetical protein
LDQEPSEKELGNNDLQDNEDDINNGIFKILIVKIRFLGSNLKKLPKIWILKTLLSWERGSK